MMTHCGTSMEDTCRKRRSDIDQDLAKELSKKTFNKKTHAILLLSTTFERWTSVRSAVNLRTHNEVAVMLLDTWDLYQRLINTTEDKLEVPHVPSALDPLVFQSSSTQIANVNNVHVPQSTLRSLKDVVGIQTDDQIVIKKEYNDEQRTEDTSCSQFTNTEHSSADYSYQSESHAEIEEIKTEILSECSSTDNDDSLMADIRDVVFNKRDKVLPVADNKTGDDAVVKSTRIKSKGFRPNYAALEWGESSDSNESESDNEMVENSTKTDDDDEDKTSEVIETDESDNSASIGNEDAHVFLEESKSEKKKRRTESKEKQSKKRKKLGMVYIPSDEEDLDYEPSDLDDSSNEEYAPNDNENASNQGDDIKTREEAKKKKKITKPYAMSEKKKKWKTIKLEDHTDKYCVEDVKSFERQHRSNDVTVKSFSCLVCKRFKCSEINVMSTHIEEHVNKVLECDKCDFIGSYHRELLDHQQTYGHLNASFVCDICGVALDSDVKRRFHRGNVHNIPEYRCPFCKEMFVTGSLKVSHMRTVHPDVCQYCSSCKRCRHTLSPEKFEEHLKRCSSVVQCETCGKEMTAKSLASHINRSHSNVRRYPCEFCRYSAKSKCSLKRHMMTHNNVHPYCCELCAFSCRQLSQLQSHMRTHTGEKPFKCTQCKYAAAWKVQLKDHTRVHEMETAVMCKQCDVLFKNDNALKLHEKKAH